MSTRKLLADWSSSTFSTTHDPSTTDDVNNTGTHGYFRVGDTWLNTTTKVMWICVDNTASAAVWEMFTPGYTIANVPTTLLVSDNLSHDVLAMTVGAWYKFTLKPALSGDGGAPTDYIEGWIKVAAVGGSVTAEGGQPVQVNVPVPVIPVTGKDHLYFMRNSDTAIPCRVYVGREDA
jgi:hypothetical protein